MLACILLGLVSVVDRIWVLGLAGVALQAVQVVLLLAIQILDDQAMV
jgi:hypothetical protein